MLTESRLLRARELHLRGVHEYDVGRPAAAARYLRRALVLLKTEPGEAALPQEARDLTARVLVSLALSEADRGRVDTGLAILTRAQELAAGSQELTVLVQGQHGLVLLRAGNLALARAFLDRAEKLLHFADPVDQCRILLNRGALLLSAGDLKRAEVDLDRCVGLAHAKSLDVIEFKARHNLGYLEFLRGNIPVALNLMADLDRFDKPAATPLLDRARVLIEAGMLAEADRVLSQAIAVLASDRMVQEVAECEIARTECALARGDIAAAQSHALSARRKFQRRGSRAWELVAELYLVQCEIADGRINRALLRRAQRLHRDMNGTGLASSVRSAALLVAECQLALEPRSAVISIPRVRSEDSIALRVHTRVAQAEAALATGTTLAARRYIRSGLAELDSFRARMGSIDLQIASAVHGKHLVELDLKLSVDNGRSSSIYEAIERGRSASSRMRAGRAPRESGSGELLTDLRSATEELRSVPPHLSTSAGATTLRRRIATLQDQVRQQSWGIIGDGKTERPASLDEVRTTLRAQSSTLISFIRRGDDLCALQVGRARNTFHVLGPADQIVEYARRVRSDLDALALSGVPEALRLAISRSARHGLQTLEDLLIRPLRLPVERLIVVPVGELWGLPWNFFGSLRETPIVVCASANAWYSTQLRPVAGGAIAGVSGPGLRYADQEVRDVHLRWGGVAVAEQATRTQLLDAMASSAVVHVAAHGTHHAENPLFSSIRLTDGPLFAYEFDDIDRVAEHVILSSCELGLNQLGPGEDALGLASVLLKKGTRSVVAGTARIPDDLAAAVMGRYHERLSAGVDAAEALAVALGPETEVPVPFVCFGSTWQMRHGKF